MYSSILVTLFINLTYVDFIIIALIKMEIDFGKVLLSYYIAFLHYNSSPPTTHTFANYNFSIKIKDAEE